MAGLIFVPLFVAPLLAFWIVLGLIWAPLAAAISMKKARPLGLNPWKYAAYAFLFSVMFIVPWLYLDDSLSSRKSSGIRDDSLLGRVMRSSHVLLYGLWLMGPIAVHAFITLAANPFADDGFQAQRVVSAGLTSVMLLAWFISLRQLNASNPGTSKLAALVPVPSRHNRIMPFVYAFLSTIASYVVLFLV